MISNRSEDILYCFTVDTDSDCFFGNKLIQKNPKDKSILSWDGFERGKNILAYIADEIIDSYGNPLRVTWFVRCDSQIYSQYEDYAYLLKNYRSWWEDRVERGDDIQWHAHLYRLENKSWTQETETKAIARDLKEGKKAFESFGIFPEVIRIGEAYHSNDLMAILEELEVKADSTALPGRKRQDQEKLIDWEKTPNMPYHPSVVDYRIPGKPDCNILEIPMNTVKTQVPYDQKPLLRYVNPAFQPGVLDGGLESFFQNQSVLVSIVHPFELLPDFFLDNTIQSHPLLAFNSRAVQKNLKTIIELVKGTGKKIRFITMKELIKSLNSYDIYKLGEDNLF